MLTAKCSTSNLEKIALYQFIVFIFFSNSIDKCRHKYTFLQFCSSQLTSREQMRNAVMTDKALWCFFQKQLTDHNIPQ